MIKKYFAMTIIAASVSLAACSDDDDPVPVVTGPTTEECEADPTLAGCEDIDPVPVVELTATVDTPAVTVYDFIGGSEAHSTLLAALNANPALANAADDGAAPITVIAPDNPAFDALIASIDGVDDAAGLLALNEGATVLRTLQYHVMGGVVDLSDTTPATDTLLVDDGTAAQLTFAAGDGGTGVAVIDSAETPNTIDLAEVNLSAEGNLYTVASVLTPPAAPVVVVPDPIEPDPVAGDGPAASALFNNAFPAQFTNADGTGTDVWTFFVPSDAAVAAGAFVEADVARHIFQGGGLDATGLAGETSLAMTGGANVAVDASGDPVTVGGFAVTLVGPTPQGGQIYAIEGILP